MIRFREYMLKEGGNVVIGDHEANRIDLTQIDRNEVVRVIDSSLAAINQLFKKKTGLPLWNDALFKSKEFLSGSAFHFFNTTGIETKDFVKVKPSVGDIDTQVDGNQDTLIRDFLDSIKGQTAGDLHFIGYKKSSGQYITLWKLERFGLNIQIDMEMVDFNSQGMPTPWATFSHSSAWEDMQVGLKGVFHKYILRALSVRNQKDVILLPKTPRGKEKHLAVHDLAFSVVNGVREKYKAALDSNGKPEIRDGKPVYQEIDTADANYVTDLDLIFKMYFGVLPNNQELWHLNSFTGVIHLMQKYYSKQDQAKIVDGFANLLWGPGAQGLYRGDPTKDLDEKSVAFKILLDSVGQSQDKFTNLIMSYYKNYRG